jgi:hypothetical protein
MRVQEWREDEGVQGALREAIATAIKLVFKEKLEVPVIASFYKERLGELLALRDSDAPALATVRTPRAPIATQHPRRHVAHSAQHAQRNSNPREARAGGGVRRAAGARRVCRAGRGAG